MIEAAHSLAIELEEFLAERNITVWLCSAWETEEARSKVNGTDLILSIGGDGTILRASQVIIPVPTPITGINLGNLGFMTELTVTEVKEKLSLILSGEGWIDERSLLEAEFVVSDDGHQSHRFYALNDIVAVHGAVARIIYVETSIDDEPLTTYRADGVIAATATGSTGYALAAGGPILPPRASEFIILPITPHLSATYSLVLPSTAKVNWRITTVHPATLSIDGHTNLSISSGTVVNIKQSAHTMRFLRIHPETSFYKTLEKRLKGKQ